MEQITVALGARSYGVKIARNLLESAAEEIRQVCPCEKLALVSDETVFPLYGQDLAKRLETAGYAVSVYSLPPGERIKNLVTLDALYRWLAGEGFTRADAVVALGGGVVGDLAGFAAATMFRGMSLIQIPTTLIAQLDSSVGGKTAVDLPEGKNLVGAFYQPSLVLIDPDCLNTLPRRQFSSGAAEAVKMGFVANPSLLTELEKAEPDWEKVIAAALGAKAALVTRDERDTGARHVLNFGHTLGHVYEAAGGYDRWLHGEAVAAGMMKMLAVEEQQGLQVDAVRKRLMTLLQKYDLPLSIPCTAEQYRRYLPLDKKCHDSLVTLVQVTEDGHARLTDLPLSTLMTYLET